MNYIASENVTNKFENDLRQIIYTDLALSKKEKDDFDKFDFLRVLSIHRELKSRLIPQQKYTVHISKELEQKINLNNFNNKDIKGINLIIEKLENSQDVTPHLSCTVKNKFYNDALYNEWKIYHLHLGTTIKKSGFGKRTKNVLFAFRDNNNNIYLIDVLPHGKGNIPWANEELLKIIDNNWSFLLDPYDISDSVIKTSINFNEQEHYKLRNNHINVIKNINNKILIPINMGQTCAGTSFLSFFMSISLNNYLCFIHNFIVNQYEQISDFLGIKNIVIRIADYDINFNVKFYIENSSVKILLDINKNICTKITFIREDIQKMLIFE